MPKRPVNIHAPIITHAGTAEGIAPFMAFVQGLKESNNTDTARAESERLNPYFKAMSVYLSKAAERTPLRDHSEAEKENLRKLSTPKALSGIFNTMAAFSRNTLISEVAILPNDVLQLEPAKYIFKDRRQFSVDFFHQHYSINFGFLQVFENTDNKMAQTTTTFPTFMLDNRMMKHIRDHEPQDLLRPLQQVMTMVNHDALHHFTMPIINSNVAHKFESKDASPIKIWDADHVEEYESWAHISHERTLLTPENKQMVEDTLDALDIYFDRLKEIGAAIEQKAGASSAHHVVDYFGMTMAHALTRIFPLDHKVMTHCLNRLKDADPKPELTLDEMANTFSTASNAAGIINRYIASVGSKKLRILQGYQDSDFDISTLSADASGYRNLKCLQLIDISVDDVLAHAPLKSGTPVGDLRRHMDSTTLRMVGAVAKTIGYKPPAETLPLDEAATTVQAKPAPFLSQPV